MLLSSKQNIKEIIITLLSQGSLDSLDLLEKAKGRISLTKQGFYKSLRELIAEEVVTKNKQQVFLSTIWLNKLRGFIDNVESNYLSHTSKELLSLQEGDTMTFKFKSILDLDLMWVHYFYMVSKQLDVPILFFNPHEFWSLFRSDIQNQLYAWIQAHNKKVYMVVGDNTPLDISTTSKNKKFGLEIAYERQPSLLSNVALTVIEDYIFYTIIDKNTTNAIDAIYKKYKAWEPAVQEELEIIIGNMKRSKVVIERNKKKAESLRKKLMKYFTFYKTI